MTTEETQLSLSSFADSAWFKSPENSTFWLQIYSMFGFRFSEFASICGHLPRTMSLGTPVKISYAIVSNFDGIKVSSQLHNQDGTALIGMKVDKLQLPSSTYAFLSTPMDIDGVGGQEAIIKDHLSSACALLRATFGWNLCFDLAFEAEVNFGDGTWSMHSSAIRMPSMYEGPQVQDIHLGCFSELELAIRNAPLEIRNKALLALKYFNASYSGRDRFLNTWISLEILCGTSGAIRNALREHYSLKSANEIDTKFGFAAVARMRHDFVHKGIVPKITHDSEPYFRSLFLDVLRWKLKLPCVGFLYDTIYRGHLDLRPLGLADRRTAEQIATELIEP